jgi:DNA-binding transcriptional ArsR family regulator
MVDDYEAMARRVMTSSDTDQLIAALSVEVCRRAWTLIGQGATSPKEIASAIGLPLPNISYHVKILREAGLITLDRTEPRRGAVEHFYRQTPEFVRYARESQHRCAVST